MKYFFEDQDKCGALFLECESWVGTPFKHRTRVKGKGVDCINLVGMIVRNVGVIMTFNHLPEYGSDWHLHNSRELLYEGILKSCKVDDIYNFSKRIGSKNTKLLDGDVLLYKFGQASAHSAIYCQGYVYHSVTGLVVTKSKLMDSVWYTKLTHILRILA